MTPWSWRPGTATPGLGALWAGGGDPRGGGGAMVGEEEEGLGYPGASGCPFHVNYQKKKKLLSGNHKLQSGVCFDWTSQEGPGRVAFSTAGAHRHLGTAKDGRGAVGGG